MARAIACGLFGFVVEKKKEEEVEGCVAVVVMNVSPEKHELEEMF